MNINTVLIILIGGAVIVFGGFFATFALFRFFSNKSRQPLAASPQEPKHAEENEIGPDKPKSSQSPYTAYLGFKQMVPVLTIVAFCLILIVVFVSNLSLEPAFRFNSAGEPVNTAPASLIVRLSLIAQLLFLAIGWLVGKGVTSFINRLRMPESAGRQSQKVIAVAANMIALPQIIAAYISFDIFIYDTNNLHILPVWAFALISMSIGGILICWRFYKIIRSKNQ